MFKALPLTLESDAHLPMKYTLEICANSVQSALNAQEAGAQRVELCDNLWEAGTTPSYASIKLARKLLNIKLFVLIRPRGGNFVYSDLEFECMKEDIKMCKTLGVDGIVSGVLKENYQIDMERSQELIQWSRPLPFTFHRAFDLTPDLKIALKQLMELRVDRVLTSGGKSKAMDAIDTLRQLNTQAENKIIIMPGGGVGENNIAELLQTHAQEFHMSGNEKVVTNLTASPLALNGNPNIPEQDYFESSQNRIQKVIKILKNNPPSRD